MKSAGSNNGRMRAMLVSVLAVAIICAGVVLSACSDNISSGVRENEKETTESSAEEVAVQLAELSEALGYENALSELTEKNTTTIDGDTYYRLQQTYQGIPVYGRTVVCVTDENGSALSITGNAVDVEEDADAVPTVTTEEMCEGIEQYAISTLGFTSEDCTETLFNQELVWYINSSGDTKLAYSLITYIAGMPYEMVVDATNGTVYTASCQIMTDSVSVDVTVDGYTHQVNLWKEEDGNYITYDEENNIRVLSANGETLVPVVTYKGRSTGTIYLYDVNQKKWFDETGAVCNVDEIDELVDYIGMEILTREAILGITQPRFESLTAYDEDACRMLFFVTVANDFFSETLYRKGWGNGATETLEVVFDCANRSYQLSPARGVSMLSIKSGSSLNTVTHELTHAMEASESRMTYSGESGAIMEALSDIFAEIVEYDLLGECDWLFDSGLRNLIDPSQSTENGKPHPDTYLGKYWKDTSSDADDNGGVHYNSTVISHTAYVMSESGGGVLGMDELAMLWYRAMLMMPSDCDFAQCRTLVELAGKTMKLSDEQMQCIEKAFDNAGILRDSTVDFTINEETELSVYGADAKLYGGYTINIAGRQLCLENIDSVDEDALELPLDIEQLYINLTREYSDVIEVSTAQSTELHLPSGTYTITLCDKADSSKTFSFRVLVGEAADQNKLDIYTDFSTESITSFPDCYIAVLENHPETVESAYGTNAVSIDTEWALYDIDKNGVPELIVREEGNNYYIYTCEAGTAKLCGNYYWPYADCLREYNGNGIVVHDGGWGSMRLEYVYLYTLNGGDLRMEDTIASLEECAYDEMHDILDTYSVIDSFSTIKDFKSEHQADSGTQDITDDVISGIGPYDIEWMLDAQGTLTIGGNGEMKDCDPVVTGASWLFENILSKTEEIEYDQIKKIVVSGSILRLGESAFSMCTSVETVVIEEGITEIGAWAFLENSSLKTIYLPESLKTIHNLAVYNCPQLTDVYYAGDESSWNNVKVLGDNSSLMDATIHYEK